MYRKIMVPLDGSTLAECVLSHAEAVAKGCNDEVILIRVVEPLEHLFRGLDSGILPEERKHIEAESVESARDYLQQIKEKLDKGITVKTEVLLGKVDDQLVDYANKNDVGLVIIASHGRSGISRWVWGSVADHILRSVCMPVMMIRAPGCMLEGGATAKKAKASAR